MSVARVYRIKAAPGKEQALAEAVEGVGHVVRGAEGCEGTFLMQDAENAGDFLFIEKWQTIDHHQKALESLPPGTLDPVVAAVAGPPEGSYMNWVFGD
jgi:quinol monooxygenase YgiN